MATNQLLSSWLVPPSDAAEPTKCAIPTRTTVRHTLGGGIRAAVWQSLIQDPVN